MESQFLMIITVLVIRLNGITPDHLETAPTQYLEVASINGRNNGARQNIREFLLCVKQDPKQLQRSQLKQFASVRRCIGIGIIKHKYKFRGQRYCSLHG